MTAATLPATEHEVPDLEWSIASYKEHQTSSGVAYVASLRRNGKKVAAVEHAGRGGAPIVLWAENASEHRLAWQEWVRACDVLHSEESWSEPEYAGIEALISEHQIAGQLQRAIRKSTPVLKQGDTVLKQGYLALRGRPTDPAVQAYLQGDGAEGAESARADLLDRYWDGTAWIRL